MNDPGCAICGCDGAPLSVDAVTAEVRAFAAAHGLDPARLCRSCGYGAVPSPCVSLCALDDAGETCRGCGRTVSEIRTWRGMSLAERAGVRLRLRGAASGRAAPRSPSC